MASRSYRYQVVDVFTEVPFEGNPLAVFPDALGLDDNEMQMLARELNLSESSFVFSANDPKHAAKVRIFTPAAEMPFAGHPTVGTAYALCTLGRISAGATAFVLEENIGPISIRLERRDPFLAWLSTPPIRFAETYDAAGCAEALGLTATDLLGENYPAQVVSAGNPFLFVAFREKAAVDRADLDVRALERIAPGFGATGVFFFAPTKEGVYARMFAPMSGVREDPATGSATGPLGAYLARYGLIENRDGVHFVNEQGAKIKRRSFLHGILRIKDGSLQTVEVGGSAVKVIDATVTLGETT
jgi:trans-2,3-dihydro-3-hydroxyanthranilate isomerase